MVIHVTNRWGQSIPVFLDVRSTSQVQATLNATAATNVNSKLPIR